MIHDNQTVKKVDPGMKNGKSWTAVSAIYFVRFSIEVKMIDLDIKYGKS